MGANHTTPSQAYQQGREAALKGKPLYANPHVGVDAEGWRKGYRSVLEEQEVTDDEHATPA